MSLNQGSPHVASPAIEVSGEPMSMPTESASAASEIASVCPASSGTALAGCNPQSQRSYPDPSVLHDCPPAHPPAPTHAIDRPGMQLRDEAPDVQPMSTETERGPAIGGRPGLPIGA